MRGVRAKYKGSFHHIYNRRLDKMDLFENDDMRRYFIYLLYKAQEIYKVHIIGYCLMNSHYHLIIKNQSNKVSEFMRYVNGVYAAFLRRECGGKGFVFEDRFGSSIIQDDAYMITVIIYVLLNPVKAGMVMNPFDYKWSSICLYYDINRLIGSELVEDYFGKPIVFQRALYNAADHIERLNLRIINTDWGGFIGHPANIRSIFRRINRREYEETERPVMRKNDKTIYSTKQVMRRFEREHSIKIKQINTHKINGKLLRGELLIKLKENAGLSYRDISKLEIFKNIKHNSLGRIYSYYKCKFANSVPSK